jgi:phosphatidyl-myo-inositol dimannoside synthase
VLSPDYPPARGGVQVLTHRLVRHMGRLKVRVVTLASPGFAEFDRKEPVDVRRVRERLGSRRVANVFLNLRSVREALELHPDVILSAHIVASPAAAALRAALRVPTLQYFHTDEVGAHPRLAGFAARHADASVAVSRHTERLVLAVGADPKRLHRIPVGVDLPEARHGDRAPNPTILTVSRLRDRYKGHDVLVRAMPLIRERVPDASWVVLGDGPLRSELERMAVTESVAANVAFLGEVSDAERDAWFDRAHVFAMPSRVLSDGVGEGFGIAYLEANAHGLPVVAGNVGGALDAVVDGETGVLVDPTDPLAVGVAIANLLQDARRAHALGRAGAARAREFAWPRIAGRVEDLLLSLERTAG